MTNLLETRNTGSVSQPPGSSTLSGEPLSFILETTLKCFSLNCQDIEERPEEQIVSPL